MKTCFLLSLILILYPLLFVSAQETKSFDIFSYRKPPGFLLQPNKDFLYYQKNEGINYCQIFLYPSVRGEADVEKDFKKNWDFFARNPSQKVNEPETIERDSVNGWQTIFGAAKGTFNKQMFAITVSTFTKGDITYFIAAVFTDKTFIPVTQDFISGVIPDEKKLMINESKVQAKTLNASITVAAESGRISKSTTSFNDGWTATITNMYVKVAKADTELRLYYTDKELDDSRPSTIDAPEYYWSKYIEPYFNVTNPEKWSGVQYPVIYHMQATAVDKQTGKACFVAIKIVYNGGARPIVVISPSQSIYQHQFPHPNDLDPMLNANRFAVTVNDIIGTWKGSGGNGVEYYNAYSGTYEGMSAVSSTDEFTFNSNGTYSSVYRSASTNSGSTEFGGQDFNGKYSVTDWSITATNRYGGKTTKYNAQLIAVKNGYLLYMSDTENLSLTYTLFKSK
jgi:hypothetical protein